MTDNAAPISGAAPFSLNRRLNLVIPFDTDGGRIFIHSVPISRGVFETYYDVIARTFSKVMGAGNIVSGPAMAFLELRSVAQSLGVWSGAPGSVENGLIGEIIRLTNVQMPGPKGWTTLPFDMVRQDRNVMDDDAEAEIMGLLVFFMCVSTVAPRWDRAGMLDTLGGLWGSQITSLDCTAHRNSLPTSKADKPADTASTSAIPS